MLLIVIAIPVVESLDNNKRTITESNSFETKKAFIFGKFTNPKIHDDNVTIETVNMREIFFKPFEYVHYTHGEEILSLMHTANAFMDLGTIIGTVDIVSSPKTSENQAAYFEIEITDGIGVSVKITNVGYTDALNAVTEIRINGGIVDLMNYDKTFSTSTIKAGESVVYKCMPLGLGPASVLVDSEADNAVHVGAVALGIIFIIYLKLES